MAHFGQRYTAKPRQRIVACPTCGAEKFRACRWDYDENPWMQKATSAEISERIGYGMTCSPHAARLRAEAAERARRNAED